MSKLTIGGLGIQDLKHLTLETLEVLKSADVILYLGTLPQIQVAELNKISAKNVRSIYELYVDGEKDQNNYERLFSEVNKVANENKKTVLLVPGHPRIGVSLVQWFEKKRQDLGYDLEVLTAVSSFDSMLNDLKRDPLEKGSLLVDANRMLLFENQWDTSLDCYIYHVCSVGTQRVHLSDARRENKWSLLKNHLIKMYGENKTVELVSSSVLGTRSGTRVSSSLKELEQLFENVHFATSLFIPGDDPKHINKNFYNNLVQSYEKMA